MLQQARGRWKNQIRRGGADHQQFNLVHRHTGGGERGARGALRQIAGGLALGRDVTLADARARCDPLVGGIDEFFQIGVGDDPLRQETAGAGDACVGQSAAPRISNSTGTDTGCEETMERTMTLYR
jgi:hypothetical protein